MVLKCDQRDSTIVLGGGIGLNKIVKYSTTVASEDSTTVLSEYYSRGVG